MTSVTTTEVMEGRMHPVSDPDRTRATRRGFLALMGWATIAVAGHLSWLIGQDIGARLSL